MPTCRTEQDIMLQVSGYHPPKWWEDPSMYIRSLEADDEEAGCITLHHIFIGKLLICSSCGTIDNYDELYPLQRWEDPSVYIRSLEAEDAEFHDCARPQSISPSTYFVPPSTC
ncbi:uncharacterized protein BJ212DRAFT_1299878 [Suillus subaureus]|uniref:Uncharacterized protein n=1 Tax=Suillus subaureus TaxID=48587 RepID=A0A9P7JDD1_9AGAM|nr:uncharacterized protein BJ212DRAFT_1299878 [Suillus subaureus]KAG1816029.1 hypothetical protein BJ212DRAFT_1299878 [Suillus subaureus]